jgi:hypothetical protein
MAEAVFSASALSFFHLLELIWGENLSIGKINKFKEIFSTKLYAGFLPYIVFDT